MTPTNRPGSQPGRSPRVPTGFTRAGGVIPIALCDPCQVGDHTACEINDCQCSHTCQQCCETGALLGGCKCDRDLDQLRGK